MKSARPIHSLFALVACLLATLASAQDLVVHPGNGSGVYQEHERVFWTVEAKGFSPTEVEFALKKGGWTQTTKSNVTLTAGKGEITADAAPPGWTLLEVTAQAAEQKPVKALGGSLVAPEKFQPAAPPPDDFDAFWKTKLKELSAVAPEPELTPVDIGKTNVQFFKITMNNIRGSHIRGQLARPTGDGQLPAILIVQWAGVYPLQKSWVVDRALEGWLVLNINAHDLPIDEPEQYYKDQAAGPLNDYPGIGNEDRETSYFLRMYLSCYRAAQYLADRSDWNRQTLVVTGGSQGGLQALLTAALHPRITAAMASVPAGCDLNGPEAQRLPGWPMWHWNTKGRDPEKVRNAARYYDIVNFAPRVHCPTLIGVGLIDTTCPPPGVFAAFNQLQGPKEIVVLPLGEHGDKNGSHRAYNERLQAWRSALLRGEAAPVQK